MLKLRPRKPLPNANPRTSRKRHERIPGLRAAESRVLQPALWDETEGVRFPE